MNETTLFRDGIFERNILFVTRSASFSSFSEVPGDASGSFLFSVVNAAL